LRIASSQAPTSRSWLELGYEWGRSGASGATLLATRNQWREFLLAIGAKVMALAMVASATSHRLRGVEVTPSDQSRVMA
jgi:hypothetical protein